MAEGGGRKVSMYRHPDGANVTRPKHGTLACRENDLMSPEEPAGDPSATKPWDHRYNPEATMGTGGLDERATETRD